MVKAYMLLCTLVLLTACGKKEMQLANGRADAYAKAISSHLDDGWPFNQLFKESDKPEPYVKPHREYTKDEVDDIESVLKESRSLYLRSQLDLSDAEIEATFALLGITIVVDELRFTRGSIEKYLKRRLNYTQQGLIEKNADGQLIFRRIQIGADSDISDLFVVDFGEIRAVAQVALDAS